jgi:hypothetical protein
MHVELTPLDGTTAIGITFMDKPVTAWGGLAAKVAEVLPFVMTSPNAMPPQQILLAFFAGVLAGARRFAQLAVLRVSVPGATSGVRR